MVKPFVETPYHSFALGLMANVLMRLRISADYLDELDE